MNILGIIPARGGSKRVPGKNIRLLNGKPLISYAIEAAEKSEILTHVVVNSDSGEILNKAADYMGSKKNALLKRPVELSTDISPAIDFVRHTLEYYENLDLHFDAIAIIQATTPLMLVSDIDNTLRLLLNSDADSAVSIVKINHMIHPLKLKTIDSQFYLHPYLEEEKGRMAAHELDEVYVRNGAVYASRKSTFEKGKIIGDKCRGFEMPPERSVDINDEMDFRFVEFLLQTSFNKNEGKK